MKFFATDLLVAASIALVSSASVAGSSLPVAVSSFPQPVSLFPQSVSSVPQPVSSVPQPVSSFPQPVSSVPQPDKSHQTRVIITTDLEVDDMNGLILSLLYSDQYDIAGIVWTAGMYHFQGDGGEHTLGEITPHYKCNATHCEHTVANAGELRYYRPVDPTWLGRLLDWYESDYQYLSQNCDNYPTPDYLRSVTKVGNIEFEGDYRYETDGSKFIEQLIMDDDPRPLIIQHWGGINTTVRALYSIYDKYHDTAQWPSVLAKVTGKIRLGGSGEDNCRIDSGIDGMFPGLQDGGYGMTFFNYGTFFAASDSPMRAADELQPYLHKDWIMDAYKVGHGRMLEQIWLMGEGRAIFGEPLIYNYGLITYMDWAESAKLGWGPESLINFPRANYQPFDWAFCQFGCAQFVDIGLREDLPNRSNHYTIVMWQELAARADWTVCPPGECNHAPVLQTSGLDQACRRGKTVELSVSATDPDGNSMDVKWYFPEEVNKATADVNNATISASGTSTATVSIPKTAKPGDIYVVNCEVTDHAARPMTRFAQFVITVSK